MAVDNIITITALNRYVKSLLESDAVLTDIRLRGEISNFVHHRSGHCYFTLKDENCSVKAVMFRQDAQQLNFEPQNGMSVVVDCRISLYERDGSFQVYAEYMFPDGLGSIRLAFEQLKNKLEKEGLFAVEHKQTLPAAPACVGVITSGSGAALQDIINVLSRRFPLTRLLLSSVTVQGNEAADSIVAAIDSMDADGQAEVIIIARGGGSAEDLWVFNNEKIARAVYRCKTPTISAVGHEIDFTILDFVADLRAPTPSAAAELAVPDIADYYAKNEYYRNNIEKIMTVTQQMWYNYLTVMRTSPALQQAAQRVDNLFAALQERKTSVEHTAQAVLQQKTAKLSQEMRLAASLNPYAVLSRGYAVVSQNGKCVGTNVALHAGENIAVETAAQVLQCSIQAATTKEKKDEFCTLV